LERRLKILVSRFTSPPSPAWHRLNFLGTERHSNPFRLLTSLLIHAIITQRFQTNILTQNFIFMFYSK
jgi:hypothetical protein